MPWIAVQQAGENVPEACAPWPLEMSPPAPRICGRTASPPPKPESNPRAINNPTHCGSGSQSFDQRAHERDQDSLLSRLSRQRRHPPPPDRSRRSQRSRRGRVGLRRCPVVVAGWLWMVARGVRGWEDTRDWAMELVGRQQFDGLFGFSQGAALVGLLGAIADGESAPISFDMAVMVSGFRAACRNTSTSSRASCVFRRCASSAALTALCRCMILCSWPSASLIRRSSSTTEDMSSPTTRRSPRESLISYDLEPRSRARSKAIDARRGRRGGLGVSAARSGQPD